MYVNSSTPVNLPLEQKGQLYGLGLFDSGMDFSQWGWQEYAALAGIAYALFSVASTTKRGVTKVRRKVKAAVRA